MFCIWSLVPCVLSLSLTLCVCVCVHLLHCHIHSVESCVHFICWLFRIPFIPIKKLVSWIFDFCIDEFRNWKCVSVCLCACVRVMLREISLIYICSTLVVEPNLHRCARCIPTPKINFSNFEIYHFSKRHSNDTLKIIHY